jgi:hypothetical protein
MLEQKELITNNKETEITNDNNSNTEEKQLSTEPADTELSIKSEDIQAVAQLHAKFGHVGRTVLKATLELHKVKVKQKAFEEFFKKGCMVCAEAKKGRAPIGHSTAHNTVVATRPLEIFSADLIGPFSFINEGETKRYSLPSLSGESYCLTVIDQYSHYAFIEPIKRKKDATEKLKLIIEQAQNQSKEKLARLHTDQGGEFVNKPLDKYLDEHGIKHTLTPADTGELNGMIERFHRKLHDMTRAILFYAKAPLELWSYAYQYAVFIHNRVVSSINKEQIPAKLMFPTYEFPITNIHTFGCDCMVHVPLKKRGKLQHQSELAIFLGYSPDIVTAGVVLACRKELTLLESRITLFKDESFTAVQSRAEEIKQMAQDKYVKIHQTNPEEWEVEKITNERMRRRKREFLVYWKDYANPTWEPEDNLDNCTKVLAEYRLAKQRIEDEKAYVYNIEITDEGGINPVLVKSALKYECPKTYQEAVHVHVDREKWKEAIEKELDSMRKQAVFEESILPNGRSAIPMRYVFTVKHNDQNQIVKWKARLVVKGFKQKYGIDFDLVFSPTVGAVSIKLLLSLVAAMDYELKQLDFTTAFLNASLKETIYVQIPEGWTVDNKNVNCLRLNRALYGLKQAPREWWLELSTFLSSIGYVSTALDHCFYMKIVGSDKIFMTIFVDDTLVAYPKELESMWLADLDAIKGRYEVTGGDDCRWIFNMIIERDRKNRTITMCQKTYIEKILENQGITSLPKDTPYWLNQFHEAPTNYSKTAVRLNETEHAKYRTMIGELLYASTLTRLDISFVVGQLARQLAEPWNYHLDAVEKVYRYLLGTKSKKLVLGHSNINRIEDFKVEIYTDSDWAHKADDRKSIGGYILMINDSPISWMSKKQSTIAMSSTEAEYYSITEGVKEALFIRQCFNHYLGTNIVVKMKVDNTGSIEMAQHKTNHQRTKHIDIRHFFVWDHFNAGHIDFEYIPTAEQLADIMTKNCKKPIFLKLRDRLIKD